jgi:steroid delta-isomerase-like uncharacterized protein
MSDHKETVRRFYEAIWNSADKEMIPQLLHEDIAFRGSLGLMQHGHAGFAGYLDFVRHALGDYRCEIVEMVAENDKVYARMAYSGVHRGDLFGYAATNTKLKWDGIAIFTFSDGKIAELWVLGDVHNVMRQLSRHVSD